jgi:uncharacterized Tic20 family protein
MDTNLKNNSLTENDRIMAALAHATVILPMTGIIAPIVIWATQKEKSKYVAFQALQAIAYQVTMIIAWLVGMAVYMCSIVAIFFSSSVRSSSGSVPDNFRFILIVMGALVIGNIIYVIYGLVGAVMVLQGKEFRYIVIGKRLERYLQKK